MATMNDLLGRVNRLYINRMSGNGVYLTLPDSDEISILLPNNQVPKDAEKGDILDVFIYKDSEDRPIATTTVPPLTIGGVAKLKVKEVNAIGAFLDWGLAKDLLLPYKEQLIKVKEGDDVLCTLYIDKSSRLCATMKVYEFLATDSPYNKDDHVEGMVYEITDSFGIFVAVDDKYSALIPHNEINRELHVGDRINARVKEVRKDGKLTLSLTESVTLQMGVDAELIMERLSAAGGSLPFHDKTSPEIIKREFQMSKNAFKRAIGRLMKSGEIEITETGIKLK